MARILTEEQYVLQNGGEQIIGMGIFVQSHLDRHGESSEYLNKLMGEALKRNSLLRKEFFDKIASGEIRKPTIIEELVMSARGHEDNESTYAARRCCQKRGIDWESYQLPKELENDCV